MHNQILQFLEEGAIDLVCLTTDLVMERCDYIRGIMDAEGKKCNCWFAGYEAVMGVAPNVDEMFVDCVPVA